LINGYTKEALEGKRIDHFIDTYVVFDLETTGLSCYGNEIIEIGAIKVENNRVVNTYSSFVKPMNNIPYYITRINGISNQMVSKAPGIDCALAEFLEFTGDYPLLGHNIISFDMKFINVASEVLFGKGIQNDYIDTLLLSRRHLQSLKSIAFQICASILILIKRERIEHWWIVR
jgi:DNA polymerase III epsilon subunit family exonuclease